MKSRSDGANVKRAAASESKVGLPTFVKTSTGAAVTILGTDVLKAKHWNQAVRLVVKTRKMIDDNGVARECNQDDCHRVISEFANSVNDQLQTGKQELSLLVGIAEPSNDGWHISVICDVPDWLSFEQINGLMTLPTLHPSFKDTGMIAPTLGFLEAYLHLSRVDYQAAEAKG